MRNSTTSILTFIAVMIFGSSFGQNLVPNPSFDIQDTCPDVSELFLAQPWNSPNAATPDLFNSTCSTQNAFGHTGIGSAGGFFYGPFPDYREYVQAPLTQTLSAGQGYCVSFWVKRANFKYAVSNMGAYFSPISVVNTGTNNLSFTPQVANDPSNVIDGTTWTQISGEFIATGNESHIIIGNFNNDATTNNVIANAGSPSEAAFYYIDDVSVTACAVGIAEIPSLIEMNIYPNPSSDILNLTIELSDAMDARIELFDATGRLVYNKDLNRIAGHTNEAINVSAFPTGLYELHVVLNGQISSRKVMLR